MQAIGDGIEDLIDQGVEWVQGKWKEVTDIFDVIMGGPEAWWAELETGKWNQAISDVLSNYLPEEYQPAASVLNKVWGAFTNKEFKPSLDFVLGLFDDLSAYLDPDALEKYKEYREYFDVGIEIGQEIYTAIASNNYGSLISTLSRVAGNINFNWGPVYVHGSGRSNKMGGYVNETGEMFQNQLQETLAVLPPDVRAQVEAYLNGELELSELDRQGAAGRTLNEIDIADYMEQYQRDVGAIDPVGAYGDTPEQNPYEIEKPQLTDRGMIGRVPMPPNCYWDADTQAWVEIGEGKAEGGEIAGGKAGDAGGEDGSGSSKKKSYIKTAFNAVTKSMWPMKLIPTDTIAEAANRAKQKGDSGATAGEEGGQTGAGGEQTRAGGESGGLGGALKDRYDNDTTGVEAFGKGYVEGALGESQEKNAYLPNHRWANKKTKEYREKSGKYKDALDEMDEEASKKKGMSKYSEKAKIKATKAAVVGADLLAEAVLDIPKIGQDLPEALDSTKEASKKLAKGDFKGALHDGGKALGIASREAGRFSIIGGISKKAAKKLLKKGGKEVGEAVGEAAGREAGKGAGEKSIRKPVRPTEKVSQASDYYKEAGITEKAAESHMKGIDFTKPVEVITMKKGTEVIQYVNKSGVVGRYFAPLGTSAKKLGINPDGRTLKKYILSEDVKVLKSTAADYNGAKGSGTQFFTKDNDKFIEVPMK